MKFVEIVCPQFALDEFERNIGRGIFSFAGKINVGRNRGADELPAHLDRFFGGAGRSCTWYRNWRRCRKMVIGEGLSTCHADLRKGQIHRGERVQCRGTRENPADLPATHCLRQIILSGNSVLQRGVRGWPERRPECFTTLPRDIRGRGRTRRDRKRVERAGKTEVGAHVPRSLSSVPCGGNAQIGYRRPSRQRIP
jgi:hypothetical protein